MSYDEQTINRSDDLNKGCTLKFLSPCKESFKSSSNIKRKSGSNMIILTYFKVIEIDEKIVNPF